MKKILLSVAIMATSLSVNAGTGFTLSSTGTPGCTSDGSNMQLNTTLVTVPTGIVATPTPSDVDLVLQASAGTGLIVKISDIQFVGDAAASGTRTSWKVYPGYMRCNTTSGNTTMVIPTAVGDKVNVTVDVSNGVTGSLAVTGADISSIPVTASVGGTTTLTATGTSISVALLNKTSISAVTFSALSTGINNATVDNGNVVKTEYFNVAGGYVGTDASALPNGIYIKKLTYENGAVASSKTILKK